MERKDQKSGFEAKDFGSSVLRDEVAIYRTHRIPPAEESLSRIRDGLPVEEFDALLDILGVSTERLLQLLGMTKSTLSRRRKTSRLSREESDRLMRFTRIFGMAVRMLESEEAAKNWLSEPAPALAHEAPLDYADTELGAREVEALLWKLEHGVYV
ncbi:MAG: antitoxin Xre/MbcA/ParS toxin-binding domain-containing protein [Verrucomicrobiota bacterium]